MVTTADIIDTMREVGIEEKILKELKYDAVLLSQGLDSIDLPAIAAATEKKYFIRISDAEASALKTLNDFAAFLNEKLK